MHDRQTAREIIGLLQNMQDFEFAVLKDDAGNVFAAVNEHFHSRPDNYEISDLSSFVSGNTMVTSVPVGDGDLRAGTAEKHRDSAAHQSVGRRNAG